RDPRRPIFGFQKKFQRAVGFALNAGGSLPLGGRFAADNFKTRNLRPTIIVCRYPSAISPSGQDLESSL
ncbi:MAG: hypothetical protein V3T45_03965, partial [Nitrospinaceae bacterium]